MGLGVEAKSASNASTIVTVFEYDNGIQEYLTTLSAYFIGILYIWSLKEDV